MNPKHISEFLPQLLQDTTQQKPKKLSVKDELINNIVENALALRTPQPKNGLIALKNIAKSVLILTPIFEDEICKR